MGREPSPPTLFLAPAASEGALLGQAVQKETQITPTCQGLQLSRQGFDNRAFTGKSSPEGRASQPLCSPHLCLAPRAGSHQPQLVQRLPCPANPSGTRRVRQLGCRLRPWEEAERANPDGGLPALMLKGARAAWGDAGTLLEPWGRPVALDPKQAFPLGLLSARPPRRVMFSRQWESGLLMGGRERRRVQLREWR